MTQPKFSPRALRAYHRAANSGWTPQNQFQTKQWFTGAVLIALMTSILLLILSLPERILISGTLVQRPAKTVSAHQSGQIVDINHTEGSITANITLFAPNPCWQHLQRVVEFTGLGSGIQRHPLGLGSRIDAQHHRFDPMQQQQLGLARALFVQPQAVIIEPNPATLKSASLQAALRRLLKENLSLILLSRESIDPLPDLYTVSRQGNTWQQVLEHHSPEPNSMTHQ